MRENVVSHSNMWILTPKVNKNVFSGATVEGGKFISSHFQYFNELLKKLSIGRLKKILLYASYLRFTRMNDSIYQTHVLRNSWSVLRSSQCRIEKLLLFPMNNEKISRYLNFLFQLWFSPQEKNVLQSFHENYFLEWYKYIEFTQWLLDESE